MTSKAEASPSRKAAAEFVGTAALVVCGPGTATATVLLAGSAFSMADLGVIALAFAMVIVAMVYAIGHVSGCHLNPAVTLALAVARKVRWPEVPGYLAAQFAGGTAGAFALWSILERPGLDAGLGVLSYAPGHAVVAFCAELIGTFLLVLVVFGTATDSRATPGWYGLAIPAVVFAVITVVGPVTGAALNPARYLGPMVARAALGAGAGLRWNQAPAYLGAAFLAGLLAAGAYAILGRSAGSGHSRAVVRRATPLKKLVNDPDEVLVDALRGVAAACRSLAVDLDRRYITRAGGPTPGKVGLLSGGGSGHEPLHGGFVGPGMLDAACAGEVFTSPVPDRILAATKAVDAGAGVLYIVKNYTGDVLNFQMAARLAAADGVRVETALVDDDVAVDNRWTAGRRGTGATVFVEKIVGAAAERGADLATAAALAREVNARSRSFGVALRPCVVPAAGRPGFELADDEIEIGVGIHGEPGRRRGTMVSAKEIAALALRAIHADMPLSGEVLVMVNGLGGTPLIELYVVFAAVAEWLAGHGVTIARSLVGNYVTSLEMAGCSITVCRLTPRLTELWDAPVDTPALRWGRSPTERASRGPAAYARVPAEVAAQLRLTTAG
jgi:phosphoenolpyruvate---glycerone phosphotransferase subunit DhaK